VLECPAITEPGKVATIAYGLLPRDVFVKVEDHRMPGNLESEAGSALRRVLDDGGREGQFRSADYISDD
jgi:hypothetical protein